MNLLISHISSDHYHNDVSHNVSHFPVSRPSPGSLGSIHHGSGHSITPWASLNHLRRLNTWVMSIITENRRQHRSQFHAAYQSQDITSSPEKNRLKHPQPQHPGFCQESKLRPRLIAITLRLSPLYFVYCQPRIVFAPSPAEKVS